MTDKEHAIEQLSCFQRETKHVEDQIEGDMYNAVFAFINSRTEVDCFHLPVHALRDLIDKLRLVTEAMQNETDEHYLLTLGPEENAKYDHQWKEVIDDPSHPVRSDSSRWSTSTYSDSPYGEGVGNNYFKYFHKEDYEESNGHV